ncbi:MAG TPA: hypothetical protein PK250_07660 [Syntrophobacter fumaroxidans]|nr:hypothetical protein [Syntrophobacter fumaroxidans]
MWLITNFGFFSIVQKSGERDLTVRARVREDLDTLREKYLPSLSETAEWEGTDYRFRAKASHAAVADAMRMIALDIDYSNFKNSVMAKQGSKREETYANVWSVLYRLQEEE